MSGHHTHVPIWVCPCTHMGPPTHPHGSACAPRWVCPHTHMGLPTHPDGSAPAPLWVHARIRQIHRHTKLVTPACLPDLRALQACTPGMSARFAGTTSLSPRHVCQFPGHLKFVPRAKPPVSRAPQACPPHETARFPGIQRHWCLFREFRPPETRFSTPQGRSARMALACSLRGASVRPPPRASDLRHTHAPSDRGWDFLGTPMGQRASGLHRVRLERSNDERRHPYQRGRASMTGLGLWSGKIIETGRLVGVALTRLVFRSFVREERVRPHRRTLRNPGGAKVVRLGRSQDNICSHGRMVGSQRVA